MAQTSPLGNGELDVVATTTPPRPHTVDMARGIGRILAKLPEPNHEPYWKRFIAEHLGVHSEDLVTIEMMSTPTLFGLIGSVLARDLDHGAHVVDSSGTRGGRPAWDRLRLTDGTMPRLTDVVMVIAPSEGEPRFGVVLYRAHGERFVSICAAEEHRGFAEWQQDRLLDRARRTENPFRGSVLDVGYAAGNVSLDAVDRPDDTRADLLLEADLWHDIDRNVHGLFARREILARLGLGMNRGVLLYGPPGTGKTQLCRVVAAELGASVTTFVCSPEAIVNALSDTYLYAERLAPSLVLLEDIDLVLGHRGRGSSQSLLSFLVSIDGAMTAHNGVVTIATTNDVDALDDAAKRAARFDRIIEVPPPGRAGRRSILERYLAAADIEVDLRRVVECTEGATGADLREIVRHAVLLSEGPLDVRALLTAAEERGYSRPSRPGLYL